MLPGPRVCAKPAKRPQLEFPKWVALSSGFRPTGGYCHDQKGMSTKENAKLDKQG